MRFAAKVLAADTDAASEEWREIPGYEGYEASSLGQIRSLDRYLEFVGRWGPCVRFHRGRVLKQFNSNASVGGTCLNLHVGVARTLEVGRGVALAFIGDPPSEEHEAAHLDSDGSNNRPGNLVWATRAEISQLSHANGSTPAGDRNARHTVVEEQIPLIIERYAKGEPAATLAKEFGITRPAISAIVSGATWGHVPSGMRTEAMLRAKENVIQGRTRGVAAMRRAKEKGRR